MAESWAFLFDDGPVRRLHGEGRADFSDGPFTGFMELTGLRPGVVLYRLAGLSTHRYSLAANAPAPEGTLAMGVMLTGHGRVTTEGAADQSWRDDESFFALTPDCSVTYHLQPAKEWQSLAFVLSREGLANLATDNTLPELARMSLTGRSGPFSHMRPVGKQRAALLARDLLRPVYTGPLGALYGEAKSLELLALHFEMLGGATSPVGSLSPREQIRVREARERLLSDLRCPPSLNELANAVGLTVRKLNRGFTEIYGATVFEHLRDARLDAAHDLLREGAPLPLKQLAWRVGYSQATNFITAYRRRFGVAPGHHRRRG